MVPNLCPDNWSGLFAITNQAKPNLSSSSSRNPRAKSGKNKTKSQETVTN